MKQKITLVRGLPGSGKSTLAKNIAMTEPDTIHVEADMFMIDEQGNYKYDYRKLKQVHGICKSVAARLMLDGHNVIVANTFTRIWEMDYYVKLAKNHNAILKVINAKGKYKSVHNVPKDAMIRMEERWEDWEDQK